MIYSISKYREATLDPKLLAMMRRVSGERGKRALPKELGEPRGPMFPPRR
jgi:hypothetical protein